MSDLRLFNNHLTGLIPLKFNSITHLEVLQLGDNNFSGELPHDICLGRLLTRFVVKNNNFIGNIPKSLKMCTSLYRMRVDNNQLTGNVSENFGIYPSLDYMDLSDNRFFGELSRNWGFSHNLTSLRMSNNQISGAIPQELGDATQLRALDLSFNKLTGRIPKSLANLTLLLNLNLNQNKLSGTIPSEIVQLSKLERLNFAANNLSGTIPELEGCIQLQVLNLSTNVLTGTIPSHIGGKRTLEKIDLSHNMLTGEIPQQLGESESLQELNLSHNEISGSIPPSFGQCFSLTTVDISYNYLEGPLPNIKAFHEASFDALRNNKDLCGNVTSFKACSPQMIKKAKDNQRKIILHLVVPLVIGGLGFVIVVVSFYLVLTSRSRNNHIKPTPNDPIKSCFAIWNFDGRMAYDDIVAATEDFNSEHCIGVGRYGSVFRVELPSGQVIAVKKLHASEDDDLENLKSFTTEISALTKVRHLNIVKLYGFCQHTRHTFLIYEFLERGSLQGVLQNDEQASNFGWMKRINVVKGVANALCYLHHNCSPTIVHRDISSKNLLLDSKHEAHISDFGIAKLLGPNSTIWTSFAGTYGYAAPELAYSIVVNEKLDVFSFGVISLEVIIGNYPDFLLTLVLQGPSSSSTSTSYDALLKDVLDNRISPPSKQEIEEVVLISKLGLACVQLNPSFRPTMQHVSGQLSKGGNRPSNNLCSENITIGQLLDLNSSAP